MEIKIIATAVFVAAFCFGGAIALAQKEAPFNEINNFCNATIEKASKPFVRVYFYTSVDCAPCKIAQKSVDKIKPARGELITVYADSKWGERLRNIYKISATPTFVCVTVDPATGKETVFDKWSGAQGVEKKIAFAFKYGVQNNGD